MRIVDLQLNIDGLIIGEDDSVENYIKKISKITNSHYKIVYEILYEEMV